MWRRSQRAWMHTHRPDFLYAILPALVLGLVTALVSHAIVPTLAGFGAFFLLLVVIHGGEYLWRFGTGKAPRTSPRTLYGASTRETQEALGRTVPDSVNFAVSEQSVEVENFALELASLLQDCGWPVSQLDWDITDGVQRNIRIRVPAGGNQGLEKMGELLNSLGYSTSVEYMPDGHLTPEILVGPKD